MNEITEANPLGAGTVKGRSTKETRLYDHRKTQYPKVDPNFQHNKDNRLPRPEPRRARAERPMPSMDERFFLQNGSGEFLHMSGSGYTTDRKCGFWATKPQIDKLIKKEPSLAELRRVPYRTVMAIGLAHGQDANRGT